MNMQIPFDLEDNQLHYPDAYHVEWKDNYIFNDTIEFITYARGRSAAYFIFKRSDDKKVIVFLIDFCDMVKYLVNGKITGEFTFCKRGCNYGCKLKGV